MTPTEMLDRVSRNHRTTCDVYYDPGSRCVCGYEDARSRLLTFLTVGASVEEAIDTFSDAAMERAVAVTLPNEHRRRVALGDLEDARTSLLATIAADRAQAVREEREACAKKCSEIRAYYKAEAKKEPHRMHSADHEFRANAAGECAAAIRARGGP